jgi:uncharacterized protein (DUF983 family)
MEHANRNPAVSDASRPLVSPLRAGIACACPRCGQGRLYAGMLTPARGCAACGLDYAFIDSGDGPAVFVILILGFVIVGLALIVDTAWSPPYWVHAVLWIPLTVVLSLWALRVMKAFMIALQYATRAGEGRRE